MRVIGIGSPFGFDRFAWLVIERLKEELADEQNVELFTLDRPGIGLIDYFTTDEIVIIDAMVSEESVSEIHVIDGHEIANSRLRFSSHEAGLAHALTLAKTLNVLPSRIKIIGPVVNEEKDSSIPTQWIDATVKQVKKLVSTILTSTRTA